MWLCDVTSNNPRVTCCHVRIWWTRVCIPQSSETWILTLAATFLSPDGQEHTIAWWLYHTISSTVVPVGSDNIWSSTKWTVKRYIYCLLYLMQNFFRAVNICFIFKARIWLWLTLWFMCSKLYCFDSKECPAVIHIFDGDHLFIFVICICQTTAAWAGYFPGFSSSSNQWCSNSVSRQ